MIERIERIEDDIKTMKKDIEIMKVDGVDFSIEVKNGSQSEHVKLSALTLMLYEQTRAFREFTPKEQHEIMRGMMEFFRFFAFTFRYKILTVIGLLGIAGFVKLFLTAIEKIDLFQLLFIHFLFIH